MPKDDLTFVEKSVLLILMAEAIELPNTELTNRHRVKVPVASRERLMRLGYVATRTENRRLYWELTDAGWARAAQELGAEVPPMAGTGGAALYAILARIKRFLERADVPYQEFFQAEKESASTLTLPEIESRIRKAYANIARRPREWVKLADLRGHLADLPRHEVDEVLLTMNRKPGVDIAADSNRKMLTDRDRDAVLVVGNQDTHVISIGV